MFSEKHKTLAAKALDGAVAKGVRITTVETVTSGLVAACITSVSGASKTFERGFILYHDSAKATGLGVDEQIPAKFGAVSAEVTKALAEGGLANSGAGICVSVTGYAGPGGGNAKDPVGTCYIAVAKEGGETKVIRSQFSGDRNDVRLSAVADALDLLGQSLADVSD
ncbi:CinA family protein [Sneathiella litorea]|uniref:Nicotinamide-nucleotide amidohydrolase family protein n=1 Tax=Sneathiella litorea TaxID=2606216 RepID=A0A6L8WAP6_9PROT|nr:CinA family protein [Sneathiella litorea]MZR31520.1 nicotinamide-nucleotide amidohydrolase family protein [Sneathiella litorea]